VARELDLAASALGNWVKQSRADRVDGELHKCKSWPVWVRIDAGEIDS
jgi:transposase-like protein